MFKKVFFVVFVLFITLSVLSFSASAANVDWKLAHGRPVDSQLDKDLKQLCADIEKATSGRVKITVFPAGQLGGSEAAMERVSMGAIEMMAGYPSSELDPKLDIYSLPGTAKNFKDLQKLFKKGTPYMNILEGTFNKLDMHVVAAYATGFSGAAFKTVPQNALDPNAKHSIKIRVPGINSYRYPAEGLGYVCTPLPWGEVFTALQTGIVDGVYGPVPETIYVQIRDIIKCFHPMCIQADTFFVLANKTTFSKLAKEDQKIINDIGNKFEAARFVAAEKEQDVWEKKLEEKGITIIRMTEAQKVAFQKKTQEYAWPKLRKEMGEKFFDEAIAAWKEAMK